MGSCTGTWILLGLLAGVASLASASPQTSTVLKNEAGTFLTNNGKTVLIGSDGRRHFVNADSSEEDISDSNNSNNIIINGQGSSIIQSGGHNFMYGDGSQGTFISGNGRSFRIINGVIELNENGRVYTFQPKAPGVNQKETVDINGQPAQVEYSNGDIIIELADHTVFAKVGNRTFMGDRYSFDNRDKLEAEARQYAERIQQEVADNLRKSMQDLNEQLHHSLGNLFV